MIWLLGSIALLFLYRFPMLRFAEKNGEYSGGDSYAHHAFFALVSAHRGRMRAVQDDTYLLDPACHHAVAYPLGFHALLYRLGFSDRTCERWGMYLPTFFDALLLMLLFCGMRLTGTNAFWLLLLPLQQIFTVHRGRSFYFNERAFGVLCGNLYILGALGLLLQGSWAWLIVSAAGCIGFSTSSKFAYQGTLFVMLVSSVITFDVFFALHWVLHVAVAVLLTRGYALQVLQDSVRYLAFYRSHLTHISGHASQTWWKECLYLPLLLKQETRARARSVWFQNPLCQIFSALPLNLVVVFVILKQDAAAPLLAMWLAGITSVLLVSLPSLRFLGSPERYLEFTLLPLLMILSTVQLLEVRAVFLAVLLIMLFSLRFITRWWYGLYTNEVLKKKKDREAVTEFLAKESEAWDGKKVLLATFSRFPHAVQRKTDGFQFVGYLSGVHPAQSEAIKELMPESIYGIRDDLPLLVKKYGVEYLVIDRIMQRRVSKMFQRQYYAAPPGALVFRNDAYEVRQCQPDYAGSAWPEEASVV